MALNHSPSIVTNGLVLYLDAANRRSYPGSGTSWFDLSGNNNHGTLTNGPTFSSANGGGIVFDGSNDYVVSANNTNISGSAARSLCAFFYLTKSSSNYINVIKIGNSNNNAALFEILLQQNSIVGHFWGTNQAFAADSKKILLNNYTYVVMTYSGSIVNAYVDGYFIYSGIFNLNTSNTQLFCGLKEYYEHENYQGSQFMAHLYNRALSPAEIVQNYNAIKGRFGL
jgi:hypothetical protein